MECALYRLADRKHAEHVNAWKELQQIFDDELTKCKTGNFEFSTLCGSYLAHLHYLSSDWLTQNIKEIFPSSPGEIRNWHCAVQGLAYMPQPSRPIYQLLQTHGVFQLVLDRKVKGRHVREKILQHIAVAYLWGHESLADANSLMSVILQRFDVEDVKELVLFFWGLQRDELSQVHVDLIIDFWRKCMGKVDTQNKTHQKLLSSLGLLTAYLKRISAEQKNWLLTIAPFIEQNYNSHFLLEYLEAMVQDNPADVGEITLAILKHNRPDFDFENRYQSIVRKLASRGLIAMAKDICNQQGLRELPEIEKLHRELREMAH